MNYDFSKFHKGCTKQIIQAPDGLHIICLTCGVSANMEAISAKVSPIDVCKVGEVDRKAIGKTTAGVDKGGTS